MNAQVQESTDIAVIPPKPPTVQERAAAVFAAVPSEEVLKDLVKKSVTITGITNQAGYDQCHAARMVLKNTRLEIARTGEAGREDAVQTSKAIITRQKSLISITQAEEDRLQAIQDAWDEAIKAEKEARIQAEIKRVQAIQDRIAELRGAPVACASGSSDLISDHIGDITRIEIDDSFAEFRDEATQAKTVTLASLNGLFAAAMDREAAAEKLKWDLAELESLRAANAERDRLAKIEADRVAAEAKAAQIAEARAHAEKIRKDNEAQEAARQKNEAALQEIQAIQHQLIIADTGRLGQIKGGTVEGHDILIAETQTWEVTEEKFGSLYPSAVQIKESTVAALKQKRTDLVARLVREEEQAEIERQNEAERVKQAEETGRIAEQRRQLEADQAAHAEAQRKANEPAPLPPLPAAKARIKTPSPEEILAVVAKAFDVSPDLAKYWLSSIRWDRAA